MNNITLVFADCFECGMRKTWADNQKAVAQANKMNIIKIPFYADGASELIRLGLQQHVSLPFFTDGQKCSKNVADFIEKEPEVVEEKPKTTKKRRTKKQKEQEQVDVASE